jgi:hypothetical protein
MFRRVCLIAFIALVTATSFAQTGTVVGRVCDKEDGSPIIGASGHDRSSSSGGSVNESGIFVVHDLVPG